MRSFFTTSPILVAHSGLSSIISLPKPVYDQNDEEYPIILTKKHFQKALQQLQAESSILAGNLSQKFIKDLEKWGLIFNIIANITHFSKTLYDFHIFKHLGKICA